MSKNLIALLVLCLLFLGQTYAQDKADAQLCADVPGQTSATHRFRQLGETIRIPIRSVNANAGDASEPAGAASGSASDADCEPLALQLHWANGRNYGSNFNVTFRDNNNRVISAKQISAFMTGVLELPLSPWAAQPVYGSSLSLVAVPATVTIQAVPPFAVPVNLSYSITRAARSRRQEPEAGAGAVVERAVGRSQGNEVVSIHSAVRLIGASRLALVQLELKTSRPFPVRDVPLQLQIGKRVFIDELSGDYTGRRLTLSLTPEMFAALQDGDEIVAFFSKPEPGGSADQDVWYFGKLVKSKQ